MDHVELNSKKKIVVYENKIVLHLIVQKEEEAMYRYA